MKLITISTAFALVITLAGCSPKTSTSAPAQSADYVFTNGVVYTVNPSQPEAQAVAVTGNTISYVGSSEGAKPLTGDNTHVIDLQGRMLVPGFVSAHDHLLTSGFLNLPLNLYGASNKQETLDRVRDYATANPDEAVIVGIGWSPAVMGGLPSKADLDAIVPERPVLLVEANTHEAWFNSAALKAANIPEDAADRQPGITYWVRDDSGAMTGVAYEFQWMDVYLGLGLWDLEKMVPPIQQELAERVSAAGITTLLNPGVFLPSTLTQTGQFEEVDFVMDYLHQLEMKDALTMRIYAAPTFKGEQTDVVEMVNYTKALSDTYNSDKLGVRGIKIHPEAGLVTQNAPFLTPYEGTDRKGALGVSAERTLALTLAANQQDLDIYIHVEGNASVRAAIDAFEAAQKAGYQARNSLHHLAFTHPDDYQRIIALDLLVNSTPQFTTSMAGQNVYLVDFLGQKRVDEQLGRYTDLAHDGVTISISADYPGTPADMLAPLYNMQVAMTLIDPSDPASKPFPDVRKRLTLEQALRAVTIDAARFMRMEDKVGSIEVGKLADLVVLEQDIRQVAINEIKDVSVEATMMDGVFRYRKLPVPAAAPN